MSPGETDFEAGRIMIERLDNLGEAGANFAFETEEHLGVPRGEHQIRTRACERAHKDLS